MSELIANVTCLFQINKHQRIMKGQSETDNPEKLTTQGTQDKDKQKKNTILYVLDTTMRKHTQIT